MSGMGALDRDAVERWLGDAGTAASELASGDATAADLLRSALQGLALVDGLPADVAREVMRVARSMSEIEWEEDAGALDDAGRFIEQVSRIQASLLSLMRVESEEAAAAAQTEAVIPFDDDVRLMEVPDDPLVGDFVSECDEHLETAEEALLELETDATSSEQLGAIFRCFHTIKGGAGLLGLDAVAELAHAAEFLLDKARNGAIVVQGDAAEICYGVLDTFRELLGAVGSGQNPVEVPAAYPAQMRELERLTNGEDAPPAGPREGGVATESAAVRDAAFSSSAGDGEDGGDDADAATAVDAPDVAKPKAAKSAKREAASSSVKVDTERLDAMIDLVGELVITNAIVAQEVAGEIPTHDPRQRVLGQLSKVTNELQSVSMSMRMVQLKGTFQKATRIVRDVARKCGKQVQMITSGEDTELDRSVVERLADPLIHMLRNAVDHGIESPEERVAAGKTPFGEVRLSAEHRAGSVVIELADDGGGFSRDRILAKAVERGIHTREEADALPDSAVWSLIFHAGLSTAESVTDVSGRGVGMDVVRKNIEALRGAVSIDSTPGHGSRFTIRLPLTLAIIDGMVIESAGRSLILPMQSIDGFVSPEAEDFRSIKAQGEVVLLRGEPIPVHRVARILGKDLDDADDDGDALLALVWADGRKVALRIDRICGQQQVVIKSLSSGLCRAPFVSGAAILGNGSVGLVVDVEALVRSCAGTSERSATPALTN